MMAIILPEGTSAELKTIAVRDLRRGDKIIHKYLAAGATVQREQIMEVTDVQPAGHPWFEVDYIGGGGEPLASPVTWTGGSQFYTVKEWA